MDTMIELPATPPPPKKKKSSNCVAAPRAANASAQPPWPHATLYSPSPSPLRPEREKKRNEKKSRSSMAPYNPCAHTSSHLPTPSPPPPLKKKPRQETLNTGWEKKEKGDSTSQGRGPLAWLFVCDGDGCRARRDTVARPLSPPQRRKALCGCDAMGSPHETDFG